MPKRRMSKPKIDEYMPFFYRKFYQAVEGYGDDLAFKYLRALVAYWDKRCVGLHNDETFLRNICRAEKHEWEGIKPIIFGQFFKQDKGLWHQDFARENFRIAIQNAEKNLSRAKNAANSRWQK